MHSASLVSAGMGRSRGPGFQEGSSADSLASPSSPPESRSTADAFLGWVADKIKQPIELNWLETQGVMAIDETSPHLYFSLYMGGRETRTPGHKGQGRAYGINEDDLGYI